MAASACLRILLDLSDDKLAKLDALGPFVSKIAAAFLESRWPFPKRHAALTPYSFMLTDPHADQVDASQLERMAADLKARLFGDAAAGDVTLLMHDGDDAATARFATMDHAVLKKIARDPAQPVSFGGRLMSISTLDPPEAAGRWAAIDLSVRPREAGVGAGPGGVMFQGVYFTVGECFVGSGVCATPENAVMPFSVFGSAAQMPGEKATAFDLACLAAATRQLGAGAFSGALFVPVSFTSITRAATQGPYLEAFARLPQDKRAQLIAVVYDAPRLPQQHAFGLLRDTLGPYFSQLDLQIADAGFDVDLIPAGTINTLTFRLPDATDVVRATALRRFLEKKPAFKRRELRPAVTNVRGVDELPMCLRQPLTYASGPAICAPMRKPVGNFQYDQSQLPLIMG